MSIAVKFCGNAGTFGKVGAIGLAGVVVGVIISPDGVVVVGAGIDLFTGLAVALVGEVKADESNGELAIS